MAIIGKIRERSTLVLIIIGLAIVAFVLTDLFSAQGSGQRGPINLAEIEGNPISASEFDLKVQQAYQNYQINAQSTEPIDERTKANIREQVWNEVVSDELLGGEMAKLGVFVTKEELFDMVQGNDPHPNVRQAFTNPETGEFNPSAVVQFIQNLDNDPRAKEQWISFERALKRSQRLEKYNVLVKTGGYLPTPLATMLANESSTQISFNYVFKPYTDIPDSTVEVSENNIKAYYEENLHKYQQEENIKFFYAYFPVRASNEDIERTRLWAMDTYESFKNAENDSAFVEANSEIPFDNKFYSIENLPLGSDTSLWNMKKDSIVAPYMIETTYFIQKIRDIKMAPDSVKASHILINTSDRTPEVAEAIADSLLDLLNNGGNMAELATANSDDVGSGQNGGDLGWFTEGMMVKPFNDAAFSAEIGDYTKVLSQFGYHLIEVTDKTAPKKKIQLATIRRTAEPGKKTYEEAFNTANSFSINVNDRESFDNTINEERIQRRVAVIRRNENMILNNAASRDLVRWAKEAKVGDISEAEDLGDAFAVAIIDEVNEEGASPLEKVRVSAEFEARKIVKAEQYKSQMSSITDLQELASQMGTDVQAADNITFTSSSIPGAGIEPNVVAKAYSMEVGQLSVPIKGNNGVYVIQITQKTPPASPSVASNKDSYTRGLVSRIDNGFVFSAIKNESDITDNRSSFY